MKLTLFLLLLSFAGMGCQAQTESTASPARTGKQGTFNVNAKEFHDLLNATGDYVVLDVRTPQETSAGMLQHAHQINIHDADFDRKVSEFHKEKPVFVYCRSGARSESAMYRMKALGFKEVYNLSGGIIAWQRLGYPLVKA